MTHIVIPPSPFYGAKLTQKSDSTSNRTNLAT